MCYDGGKRRSFGNTNEENLPRLRGSQENFLEEVTTMLRTKG